MVSIPKWYSNLWVTLPGTHLLFHLCSVYKCLFLFRLTFWAECKTASFNFSEPAFTWSHLLDLLLCLCGWPVCAFYGVFLQPRQPQITGWDPANKLITVISMANTQRISVTVLGRPLLGFYLSNLRVLGKLLADISTCVQTLLCIPWTRIWAPVSQRVCVGRGESGVESRDLPHWKVQSWASHGGRSLGSLYNSSERLRASTFSSRWRKLDRLWLLGTTNAFKV